MIGSFCFIYLHIFGWSSLKLEYFSSAGVIPPSRSWITCALNVAEYERRFFFKWRYLFFLSPTFRFPNVSDEDVSIDEPSNSSSLVTLTTTRFPPLEDCSPGWLITTLCLHLIWVEKAPVFSSLSLQKLQVRGFSSQTTLDISTSSAFQSFFATIFLKPKAPSEVCFDILLLIQSIKQTKKPLNWICISLFENLQAVQCNVFWIQSCLM